MSTEQKPELLRSETRKLPVCTHSCPTQQMLDLEGQGHLLTREAVIRLQQGLDQWLHIRITWEIYRHLKLTPRGFDFTGLRRVPVLLKTILWFCAVRAESCRLEWNLSLLQVQLKKRPLMFSRVDLAPGRGQVAPYRRWEHTGRWKIHTLYKPSFLGGSTTRKPSVVLTLMRVRLWNCNCEVHAEVLHWHWEVLSEWPASLLFPSPHALLLPNSVVPHKILWVHTTFQ